MSAGPHTGANTDPEQSRPQRAPAGVTDGLAARLKPRIRLEPITV